VDSFGQHRRYAPQGLVAVLAGRFDVRAREEVLPLAERALPDRDLLPIRAPGLDFEYEQELVFQAEDDR
jgi:hypothetical protein